MAKKIEDTVSEPVEQALPIPAAPVKKYSFEQWSQRVALKESHKRGLKAYVRDIDRLRTMEEWDTLFKNY